jgi:hypothetical protein
MKKAGEEGLQDRAQDTLHEKETSLLLSGGLQLSLTLGSRDEMHAVLKAYS